MGPAKCAGSIFFRMSVDLFIVLSLLNLQKKQFDLPGCFAGVPDFGRFVNRAYGYLGFIGCQVASRQRINDRLGLCDKITVGLNLDWLCNSLQGRYKPRKQKTRGLHIAFKRPVTDDAHNRFESGLRRLPEFVG
jgi:hypothetical protein